MAYTYDGSNDAHSIPDISSLGDYTIVFNALAVVVNSGPTFFAWDNYPTSPRNQAIIKPNSAGQMYFEAGVANTGGTALGTPPTAGQFFTYAITRSGTTAKAWQDGIQISTDITVGAGTFTAENIRISCHFFSGSNNEFSNSTISEIAIYNVALSTSELLAIAKTHCPLTGRRAGLIRYVPLIRNAVDVVGGVTVTAIDAPTVANHPNVIYPRVSKSRRFSRAVAAPTPLRAQIWM